MKPSLLFIPDISGFTKFVNKTEIEHSQHIIAELLEAIIDANELGMTVSEIEGDAVLFYKDEDVPPLDQLVQQVQKMFLDFHQHLASYKTQRVCQCGACSTASELTLKMIIHAGPLDMISVRGHEKLHGSDVILAHRLLKNNITTNEYALFTDQLLEHRGISQWPEGTSELKVEQGESEYDEIGPVMFHYLLLNDLHKQVEVPARPVEFSKSKDPIAVEVKIKAPTLKIYELISNLEYRSLWQEGVEITAFDKDRVNRVGSKHTCVFSYGEAEIETVTDFRNGQLVFGERTLDVPLIKELIAYFILTETAEGASLKVEAHLKPKTFKGKLVKPFLKKKFKKVLQKQLNNIRDLAEKQTDG